MNIRIRTLFGISLLLLTVVISVQAQQGAWPKTLPVAEGSITVYPMQVEEMNGDLVKFRAALAYRQSDDEEPVFGVGWFVSKVEIDRAEGIVHPVNLMVSDTRFPPGTGDVKQDLTAAFAQQAQGWNLDFPVDELVTALKVAEQEARSVQDLNNTPPAIIYKDHPALLVSFDGEPVLREIENSDYQAVINTSYPLIYDGSAYHLAAADEVWYRADQATGPYRFEAQPPTDIVAMVDAAGDKAEEAEIVEKVTAANAPEIVVATRPTELIVTEGPAAFVPLVDDLLVLSNTAEDVFMHISSQEYYVVLAGRWYHSRSLNGPWTYSASNALPQAFSAIPDESDQADARVYVAGTEEARDAVLDAQIPQTAAIERGKVDLDVNYDGDPVFEPVEGAEDLAYANNSGSTVLQADRQYYLVEDGVWYVSSLPNGPWEVSAYRPEQVASISPRSPVYNVKYVYIYDSTPDIVYVGYTPGYTGSYVYGNTIVYGTGWYYQPWVSPYYYYPRYSTWGFNVSYNPWNGWSFGLSWGWGPFYAGYYSGGYWHYGRPWYSARCNWWGPRGYRPRPAPYGRYAYGRSGYNQGRYNRGAHGRGNYGRYDNGRGRSNDNRGHAYTRNENLYRDNAQRAKLARFEDYGRRGEKLSRGKSNLATSGKYANKGIRTVSRSELRTKAAVRDSRFDANNGKVLANNTVTGKRRLNSLAPTARKTPANSASKRASISRKTQPVKSGQRRVAPQKMQTEKVRKSGLISAKTAVGGGKTRSPVYSKAPATKPMNNSRTTRNAPNGSNKERSRSYAQPAPKRIEQSSRSSAHVASGSVRQRSQASANVSSGSIKQRRQPSAKISAPSGKQFRASAPDSRAYKGASTRQASAASRPQPRSAPAPKAAHASRNSAPAKRVGGDSKRGNKSARGSRRNN